MNLLPLLGRELQTALRRPMTGRLRMAFAGGSMIVALWAILVSDGDMGGAIFVVLVAIGAILSMFVAIFVASDSIARERREGTLDLLLLTDLRPGELILGKIAASGLVPVYTLLGMFPALALSQLMGGVAGAIFWSAILALLVTLVFSLSATIYVSSLFEDHRKAYAGATALLLVANPLWLCMAALNWSGSAFLLTTVLFCGLSALFLRAAATRVAERFSMEASTGESAKPEEPKARAGSRTLLNSSPVAWMMARRRAKGEVRRLLLGSAIVVLFFVFLPGSGAPIANRISLWSLFLCHFAYQIVLMTRAAYAFYGDRQNGSLELLLGSPLSNEEIFEGFNLFLLRQSIPMLAVISALDGLYALRMWMNGLPGMAAMGLALALTLWIALFGLGWLGVYRSLMMNHPSLAMLATYARLSLVPVVLSLIFMEAPNGDLRKVAAFYLITAGFLAAFFSIDAKAALGIHGRTLLLRPYSEKPPEIESEWSFIDWEEARNEPSGWRYAPREPSSATPT